jgi:hypothetical protein
MNLLIHPFPLMIMYLSELGQVEGSDLFCLFDLLLVGADLCLQLIDQGLGDKLINQNPGLHYSPIIDVTRSQDHAKCLTF